MKFQEKLIQVTLLKRYKRFLADVQFSDGTIETVYCPNTGSMKTCGEPGDSIYLSHSSSKTRKYAYTWELTKTSKGLIGINTQRPNQIVKEAILENKIPELNGFPNLREEVKYGTNSRIDILLENKEKKCWVEVKNVTLLHENFVTFPDAVSVRALKHLHELDEKVKLGDRAVIFFLVNRAEGEIFRAAKHIDPKYAEKLKDSVKKGVELLVYRCLTNLAESKINHSIPYEL